jgi:diguanylate cyclase (GGDEF)-like protein
VAILAAAFNLIVSNGVTAVEYVTRSALTASSNGLQPAPTLGQSRKGPGATTSQLYLALDNFDRAVREHIETHSKATAALYAGARTELNRIAVEYAGHRVDASEALENAISVHEKTGEDLVQVAHNSNIIFTNYSGIFTRIDARLQTSIDRAWKIMGRVIARQSLLKLNAQLDNIQDRFASRGSAGIASAGSARLSDAEDAFAMTLQQSESPLRRSQGAEWYEAMRSDFTALTKDRVSLARLEKRKSDLVQMFSRETVQLVEALSRPSNPEPELAADSPASDVPRAASLWAVPQQVTRTVTSQQTPAVALVAWVSAIVLAVLAYICIVTVLSVVRPVRLLLAATRQIASGTIASPIPPGGIRELNSLSHAFNAMAEQIAIGQALNRESHHSLEAKVEERTRQLQDLAERDPLTGLANRRQLFTALNASIGRAAATMSHVGVFFLDIDNFKTLNDSLGHEYGDRVLTAIARRLEAIAQPFGFAARLGGDEFMLVHDGAETIDEIVASGTRIVNAFQYPIPLEGRELIVSVSVGVSVYPDHGLVAEALLRAADAALFSAKAQGRSQLNLFTPDLLVRASNKFVIEQRLRRAIEKGEFELFYQPEVSTHGFEVSLVEALIRWRMPDGSYKAPAEFLAVAEESGLIMEINDWVLRTAIEAASQWHHGAWSNARVAINVSPRQFLDYRFVEKLQLLLDEFALPPRCLELELTESVLQTGPTTITALSQLRAMGVAIALDDFGTGYSSMASLEQLPLTRIKLDRSLIARMDSNARSASIANATIGLCGELGLSVTAEGVERLEQFTMLLPCRGMALQGYLLARPVAFDQVLPLLKRLPAHCQELLLMSQHRPVPALPSRVEDREADFAIEARGL